MQQQPQPKEQKPGYWIAIYSFDKEENHHRILRRNFDRIEDVIKFLQDWSEPNCRILLIDNTDKKNNEENIRFVALKTRIATDADRFGSRDTMELEGNGINTSILVSTLRKHKQKELPNVPRDERRNNHIISLIQSERRENVEKDDGARAQKHIELNLTNPLRKALLDARWIIGNEQNGKVTGHIKPQNADHTDNVVGRKKYQLINDLLEKLKDENIRRNIEQIKAKLPSADYNDLYKEVERDILIQVINVILVSRKFATFGSFPLIGSDVIDKLETMLERNGMRIQLNKLEKELGKKLEKELENELKFEEKANRQAAKVDTQSHIRGHGRSSGLT